MGMTSLVLVDGPEALPVTEQMVWDHLRLILDGDQPVDKALVDELVAAAVDRLDGPSGLLNRALISQTWKASFDRLDSSIEIPLARCQSVDGVTYLDSAGVSQTLDPSLYRLVALGTDRCKLQPARGASWPSVLGDPEAATVTFTSGFGDGAEDVPATIRAAILEIVATSYVNRTALPNGAEIRSLPGSARNAVMDWQVWRPEW